MPDIPRQLKLTAGEILCPQHEFFPNSQESQDQLRSVLSRGLGKKKASGQGGEPDASAPMIWSVRKGRGDLFLTPGSNHLSGTL